MNNKKKLFIVRHAKSSWKDISLDDFDRPLNKRGKGNASMIGKRLRQKKITPDIILSSSAKRAKSTARLIAKDIKYNQKIILMDELYESDSVILDNILKNLDDKYNIVFLIGHNPELNMLAEYYIDFKENIVTCGVVEIDFNCNKFKNINKNNSQLISFDYPKKKKFEL